jgi:two-component system CheB/CheR fusion protein
MKPGLSGQDDVRWCDLAIMSHELKQPLTELLLGTEQLLEQACGGDAGKLHDIGQSMKSTIRRQARIIDDLLEFSRIRTGKLSLELMPVDIAGLVRAACDAAARMAPRMHIRADIRCDGTRRCLADPVRMEQMLSNLLGNAIKFSHGGGRIDVQLGIERHFARISVADDGCGIAAEFLPHVFSLFGQESRLGAPPRAGLGIGLALVRELATAHGGRVEARSDGPGRGAQFVVWLPLIDGAAPGRALMHRHAVAAPGMHVRGGHPQRIGAHRATR